MENEKLNLTDNHLKQRNSIIELLRFLFAMWVVYYHGYFFLPKTQYFCNGYLSVDFFFMLTGFFIMESIIKEAQKPYVKGLKSLLWKKLKPLGVTLIISLIFALTFFFLNLPELGDPLGFMWYIEWMLIVPAIYFTLYYLIKNNKRFCIVVGLIVIASFFIELFICKDWGMFRGLISIGIGILISLIPKNNWKIKKLNINIIIATILIITTFICACYKNFLPNSDNLFILLLFPTLLYFSSCVKLNFKLFNYLGSLSFGLYAYQTICRVLEKINLLNDKEHNLILFLIILVPTILDNLIRRILKKRKIKKQQTLIDLQQKEKVV